VVILTSQFKHSFKAGHAPVAEQVFYGFSAAILRQIAGLPVYQTTGLKE
jgi:hypothetical protein